MLPPESWPFDDPPNLGIFLSRALYDGTDRQATRVTHDEDGDWIINGDSDLPDDAESWVLAHLAHVVELWPALHDVADLPRGWSAELEETGTWSRFATHEG